MQGPWKATWASRVYKSSRVDRAAYRVASCYGIRTVVNLVAFSYVVEMLQG